MYKIMYCIFFCLAAGAGYSQIGFGTTSPNSSLDVRGAVAMNLRSFTGSSTAGFNDQVLVFNGTTAATLTLPDATTCTGRIYWIKNASATAPTPLLTVAAAASQLIGGVASTDLSERNQVIRLVSNGSSWAVFSANTPVRKTTSGAVTWNQGGNTLTALKAVGTTSNMSMAFKTNGLERMRLTPGGDLGLGTTSPEGGWHAVNENDDAGNDYIFEDYGSTVTAGIYLRKHRGTVASPQNLQNGDIVGQFRYAPRFDDTVIRNAGAGVDAVYTGDGSAIQCDLRFYTSDSEQVRLTDTGRLAVGVAAAVDPGNPEKLRVDAGNTTSYNVISGKGEIDNYLQLNIKNTSAGGSASSDVVATADNGTENVNYIDMGINSGGYTNSSLPILSSIDQPYVYSLGRDLVIGNGAAGYNLVLFTNGYALSNERMRINATGEVLIGTTTTSEKLTVGGVLAPSADNAYSIGTSAARWSAVYAATGTIQTSDIRLKTHIAPLEYGVQTVMALQPVYYNWKGDATGKAKIGLLAQDVKKLVPEVVTGNEQTDRLGMNYAELVAVLIKTIQQQNQQLEQLSKELDTLEQQ